MQIYGPFRVSTTQSTPGANRTQAPAPATPTGKPTATPVDQLDLSSSAATGGVNRLASTSSAAGGGEIRTDRVADLRRQIAEGKYDTPEKMDAALDRLLDQFA